MPVSVISSTKTEFIRGLKAGTPILLGYLPISFAFAISVVSSGLPWQIAVLMSITNFTSSGQFAGATLMVAGTSFLEIGVTVFLINIRYLLMSLSLSQKFEKTSLGKKFILAHFITDEVYVLASNEKEPISRFFFYGLAFGPYLGWIGGTILGVVFGTIVPPIISASLGISLYAMFIAIIIPPAKKSKPIAITIAIAVILSSGMSYLPKLNKIPAGWALIICCIIAASIAAVLFPVKITDKTAQDEVALNE